MTSPPPAFCIHNLHGLRKLMSCLDTQQKVADVAASSAEASSDEFVPHPYDSDADSEPEWSDDSDADEEPVALESLPSDPSESSRLIDFASVSHTLPSTSCLGEMAALLASCSEDKIRGMSFRLVPPMSGPQHFGDSTPISITISSAGRPRSEYRMFPSQALQALKAHFQALSSPASSTAP